jgi:membrane associated rhomboid family serine protease
VLPIGDVNPTRRPAYVMWSILAINLGVFAYQFLVLSGCDQVVFAYEFGAVPRELTSRSTPPAAELEQVLGPCAVQVGPTNAPLSLVTSMFLHGGLAHLVGNLVYLAVFGNNVEDRLGHARFVLFYVVGGVAATVAFAAVRPSSSVPLVGASGAIAAVLGAYLICYPRARVFTLVPFPLYLLAIVVPGVRIVRWLLIVAVVVLPAWLLLSGWFLLQAAAAGEPTGDLVAYEAHVAGFVAGIVLVLLLDRRRRRRGRETFHPVRQPPRRR